MQIPETTCAEQAGSASDIVRDVASVMHGFGFEVRPDLGAQHPFSVAGSLDSAAQMLELMLSMRASATITLPTWAEADAAVEADSATPLHVFIHDQEPAGPQDAGFRRQLKAALDHAVKSTSLLTAAARDVLAERQRQVEREGYTPENDDAHVLGELGAYAAFYAMPPGVREWPAEETGYGSTWGEAIIPQNWTPPKPGNRRDELVKAAALLLAELERIDRADPSAATVRRAPAACTTSVNKADELHIGMSNNDQGVHVNIIQKHADGTSTMIFTARVPAGDSYARASLAQRVSSAPTDRTPTANANSLTADDYEEILADHRRLARDLDVLLNGESGAAKQARLAEIVAQVRRSGTTIVTNVERRLLELGGAIERACAELPEGFELHLELERGAGNPALYDECGERCDEFSGDTFADKINSAISYAVAAHIEDAQ